MVAHAASTNVVALRCFSKTRFAWRDGKEEDVLKVYFLEDLKNGK